MVNRQWIKRGPSSTGPPERTGPGDLSQETQLRTLVDTNKIGIEMTVAMQRSHSYQASSQMLNGSLLLYR